MILRGSRRQLAAGVSWGEGSRGGSAQQPCTSHIIINLWNLHRMTGQQFKGRQAKHKKYVRLWCQTFEFLDNRHTGSVVVVDLLTHIVSWRRGVTLQVRTLQHSWPADRQLQHSWDPAGHQLHAGVSSPLQLGRAACWTHWPRCPGRS